MTHHDPDLNLSPAEQIRLAGLGVYLDTPLPERLRNEVRSRWTGRSSEYERGFQDRTTQAYYEQLDLLAQARGWERRFRDLIIVAAFGWTGFTALAIWAIFR